MPLLGRLESGEDVFRSLQLSRGSLEPGEVNGALQRCPCLPVKVRAPEHLGLANQQIGKRQELLKRLHDGDRFACETNRLHRLSSVHREPRRGHPPRTLGARVVLESAAACDLENLRGFVDATLVEQNVGEPGRKIRHSSLIAHPLRQLEGMSVLALGGHVVSRPELERSGGKRQGHERFTVAELREDRPSLLEELASLRNTTVERVEGSDEAQHPALKLAAV